MINRYYFFKNLFPKYVVIFEKKGKYISYGLDKTLMKYTNLNEISYIIIDRYNNTKIYNAIDNKYDKYLIKEFLLELFS